jgi:ribonucleoside-diphosphate reductase alpha subunit
MSTSMASEMYVVKRDGRREAVAFEKVSERLRKVAGGLRVNVTALAQKVLVQIVDNITTSQLDELAANLAISNVTVNPDYGTLAARVIISNHQKNTPFTFAEAMTMLSLTTDKSGRVRPVVDPELARLARVHSELIESHIDYERDYLLDFFGFKTLEKAYLARGARRAVVERPQHMWMRVALGLWLPAASADNTWIDRVFKTYDMMSRKLFTHATPTLFNCGTPRPQLSSCFLLALKEDSIEGIYDTLKQCALISQHAGGIGLHIHNLRARGSAIHGTNGTSNGLVPMLRNFNSTARYVDQCFGPGTLIQTSGGLVAIEDILPGTKVLTSGCTESVEETGKHYVQSTEGAKWCEVSILVEHEYVGEILWIVTDAGEVWVTPSHPVLVSTALGELDYVEIGKLSVGTRVRSFNEYGIATWITIKEINQCSYSGKLYDLEIDGTHDYVVSCLGVAHNGGGKRNGSFAIYLEPWHADIQDFLKLKLNNGNEEERCRDLFYALWVPDLFMERVQNGGDWTLFCPAEAPGLADVVGDDFKALYERYEREGRGRSTLKAQKLWFEVLDSQIETGTPYLVYKDAANKKSNQQNLGVIKSSNLCSEIIEYSSPEETAVCNLASLGLPSFVHDGVFDFVALREAVRVVIRNLNQVIDINYYPTPETWTSNMRHRPVGLGVQGLADVFAMMRVPWEVVAAEGGRVVANPAAILLNKRIFAHIYYAAVEESCLLAQEQGPYSTFEGSPASAGKLQPDLWNVEALVDEGLDWDGLRAQVQRHGLRNSLLVAPMPTASTSQILGFNECFEPFTTNIYKRLTLAGEFIQVNKYLVAELIRLGLWSTELKDRIVAKGGSVQGLAEIPADIQMLYKTVWELKQKTLIDLAADRGAYICQSQSLNLFVADPDYSKLTSMHFYAWQRGLKTGIYYLRTKPPVAPQQVTIDPTLRVGSGTAASAAGASATAAEEKECLMCSS